MHRTIVPFDPPTQNTYNKYIKIHDSELRGQEEAGLCDEQVSYIHVAPL